MSYTLHRLLQLREKKCVCWSHPLCPPCVLEAKARLARSWDSKVTRANSPETRQPATIDLFTTSNIACTGHGRRRILVIRLPGTELSNTLEAEGGQSEPTRFRIKRSTAPYRVPIPSQRAVIRTCTTEYYQLLALPKLPACQKGRQDGMAGRLQWSTEVSRPWCLWHRSCSL